VALELLVDRQPGPELEDRKFQDLYHFTVGGPLEDTRLTTLAAYLL